MDSAKDLIQVVSGTDTSQLYVVYLVSHVVYLWSRDLPGQSRGLRVVA